MTPRVRRILVAIAAILGGLLVVLAASLYWLLGTGAGLRFLVAQGLKRSPVAISVGRVDGRVLGPIRIARTEVNAAGTRARVASFELDWNPGELFARRLHVRRLVLDGIAVTLAAPDTAAKPPQFEPFRLPDLKLPVTVVLDTVRLRSITLRQAGRGDSLLVSQIALDGLQYRDSLGVQRFALATPWGELGFRGWVRTHGAYPLDLAYRWDLTPPKFPRVVGSGAVTGNFDTLTVRQDVTAPVRLFATVRLESLTTRPRFDLQATLQPVLLATLVPGAPKATVGGTLGARGDLARQDVTLAASWDLKDTGRWDLAASARAGLPDVELTRLALTQRGSGARVEASGRARVDSTAASFTAKTAWTNLAWPLVGAPLVTLPRGTLDARGTAARWNVALATSVRTPAGREESIDAAGVGDSASFDLERFAGTILGGTVAATGRVAWSPAIAWQASLAAEGVDVGALAADWPSSLSARVETDGTAHDTTWSARVDVPEIGGTLRGRPVAGRVHFDGASGGPSAFESELRYASAVLHASGSPYEPLDVAWSLAAPKLAELDTALAGSIEGSGRIVGPDSLAYADARLAGTGIEYGGMRVGEFALAASLDRTKGDSLDVALSARRLESPPLAPFDSLHVALGGARAGYTFAAALESARRRLAAAGSAKADGATWTGALDRLEMQVAPNAPWSLAAPVPFEADTALVRVGPLAWRAGPARLDASGEWRARADARIEAALAGFPLANLNAFLPESTRVEGALSSRASFVFHPDGVLEGTVDVDPTRGRLSFRTPDPVSIDFENVTLHAASDANALAVKFGGALPELGDASGDVELAGFRWTRVDSTQAIAGSLRARADRWGLLEELSHDVRRVRGRLDANLEFGGTIAVPTASGEVRLADGGFDAPGFGLEVSGMTLDAKGGTGGKWQLDAAATSGKGSLATHADADLSDASRPRAQIKVSGKDFELVDITEARILASPDLSMKLDGARVDLGGSVTVPYAHVDVGNKMLALAVPPSPDVIVPRAKADSTVIPFELHTDVRLTLGDDVKFKGYGIEAKPTGSVRVTQEPNKPALGQGELALTSGTYSGYGRDLKIERGRLVYAGGPVDDPEVDIRASREVKDADVTVGFEVKGTIKQSEMEVFADPEMSQSDAISYLLFNRPVAETKSSESAVARETATAIGLQAGSAYTQKMASKVGLSEASLESEGTLQQASLMLGTYLTPSLYARYGIGLFDSANTFQLSYLVNKHWTVKAESSEQNRAGILYTIEPGRKSAKKEKGPSE